MLMQIYSERPKFLLWSKKSKKFVPRFFPSWDYMELSGL